MFRLNQGVAILMISVSVIHVTQEELVQQNGIDMLVSAEKEALDKTVMKVSSWRSVYMIGSFTF